MNQKLKEVMENNLLMCKEDKILFDAIKESRKSQKIYTRRESIKLINPRKKNFVGKNVVFSSKRSFEAASDYDGMGRIAVLNFANAFNPGGGCLSGATAQEESLCRCSTLYECLISPQIITDFYQKHKNLKKRGHMNALGTSDFIYTKDVIVFMSDTEIPSPMSKDEWFYTDIITCAAPHLSSPDISERKKKILEGIIEKRLERTVMIAINNNVDILILGAFGCGAFNNPPHVVAKAMKKVVFKYHDYFNHIEIALYDSAVPSKNQEAFHEVFFGGNSNG